MSHQRQMRPGTLPVPLPGKRLPPLFLVEHSSCYPLVRLLIVVANCRATQLPPSSAIYTFEPAPGANQPTGCRNVCLKTPSVPGVAPLADGKIVTSERFLSVVTSHTTRSARGGMVIKRLRGCYVFTLNTSTHAMAIITIQAFVAVVLCVAETNSESSCSLTDASVTSRLMTCATRCNVSTASLSLRCVTLKAGAMRVESRWNRHRHCAS